jgi:hypothetical protein
MQLEIPKFSNGTSWKWINQTSGSTCICHSIWRVDHTS